MAISISNRARETQPSPMRKFERLVRVAESEGFEVLKLNIGDPDLPAPMAYYTELQRYLGDGGPISYTPTAGLKPFIDAWIRYFQRYGLDLVSEQVLPTVGGSEGLLLSLLAVTDPGDEVIVFEPLYASVITMALAAGIKLVPITLELANKFYLHDAAAEVRRRITKKTRAILIINPDNPTGKVWMQHELDSILAVAEEKGLCVISDETYRDLVFSGDPVTLMNAKTARGQIVVVNSLSKIFSIPGARIGALTSHDAAFMDAVTKFAMARLSAGILEQMGSAAALEGIDERIPLVQAEYRRRCEVLMENLSAIPGIVLSDPKGAFYIAAGLRYGTRKVSADDLATFLIREFSFQNRKLLVAPMEGFYLTPGLGTDQIRIAYVLEIERLIQAVDVLKRGLRVFLARSA